MSHMRDLSKAIRQELSEHGEHISMIPDSVLVEYTQILGAFYADLHAEMNRRHITAQGGRDLSASERQAVMVQGDKELASELGVKYATRCVCQHVVIFSDKPIDGPQILPCCETGECPQCVPEGYEHALELHQ